jgi:TonB family protein
MILLTAIVSSAATYLITTYLRSAEKTSSTAVPGESSGTTTTKPIENSAPVAAGAIAGAEASLPNADYPPNAKIQGVTGSVTVLVRVNGAGGVVIAARALNGDRQLRVAAERAARKARFSPDKLPRDTKVVSGTITYRFGATTTASNPTKENDNSPVVGGGLVGAQLSVPNAAYPEDAKSRGVGGNVMVLVQVNRSGEVVSARALNGDQALQDSAETAAAAAKFSPEKLPNEGNVISGTIIYKFSTNQQAITAGPLNQGTPAASPVAPSAPATQSNIDSPVVGGDLAGKQLNVPKAEYPPEARRRRVAGTVKILVRVNKQGKVVSWKTLNGDPLLKPAAIEAARSATFSPEKLGDGPSVLGTITYTFKP